MKACRQEIGKTRPEIEQFMGTKADDDLYAKNHLIYRADSGFWADFEMKDGVCSDFKYCVTFH